MVKERQNGQAMLLLVLALGLFLIGAVGLAVDISVLYTHRQLAQAAADAAAEAGILSVFNHTNSSDFSNVFGASDFTCTTGTDDRTPCVYARYHGFGTSGNETVSVDFPTSVPGVSLSDDDDPAALGVTVSRTLDTGFAQFLGSSLATVRTRAVAAITDVFSPVPIIILHPTLDAALDIRGGAKIKICGGPTKSIQVNSNSLTSIEVNGGGGDTTCVGGMSAVSNNCVDLSEAGPEGWVAPFSCNGNGADFGDFGGPKDYLTIGNLNTGVNGEYICPASPIADPLRDVPEPGQPGAAPVPADLAPGVLGCPANYAAGCKQYSPGHYPTGILVKNEFAIFLPGLYYTDQGIRFEANAFAHMAPCAAIPGDDFGCGMLVLNTSDQNKQNFFIGSNAGDDAGAYPFLYSDGFGCSGICLQGTKETGTYKGILFFQKRTSGFQEHELQGGGNWVIRGTIYLTNTEETMRADPTHFQDFAFGGNSGGTTRILGMIIVDRLRMHGTPDIVMTLNPNASLNLRQVALVR